MRYARCRSASSKSIQARDDMGSGRLALGRLGRQDGNDGAGGHQHDQSALGAGHVEIGPHLRAIVIERSRCRRHIAFPVHDDGGAALGRQGQGIGDPAVAVSTPSAACAE